MNDIKVRNYLVDDDMNRDWLRFVPRIRQARGGSKAGRRVRTDKLTIIKRIKKEWEDLNRALNEFLKWGEYRDMEKKQGTDDEVRPARFTWKPGDIRPVKKNGEPVDKQDSQTKAGNFITHEGRIIFVGGPGSGGGGSGPSVQVGITSARPEDMSLEKLQKDMVELENELKATTAENVKVQLGTGGWEGGGEPTFITSYDGDGEALAVLAKSGKKWNQDGVLVMVSGGDQPQSRLSIGHDLDLPARKAIEEALVENGIGGWTWGKTDSGTLLMATNVPQWGGDATKHREGIQTVLGELRGMGLSVDFEETSVEVIAMDGSNYDSFIP